MSNNKKGKRIERYFAKHLRKIFPNVKRNLREQSSDGGVDLVNCDPFNLEIKGGKKYTWKGVRDLIEQVEAEGKPENYDVVLVKPHREDEYALIPFDDFMALVELLRANGALNSDDLILTESTVN